MKRAYQDAALKEGLEWKGRLYTRSKGDVTDVLNKCLSVAASCLYGICHAALVAVGFSPALGFVHTGDMRAFVLDIADLYRESVTIPVSFAVASHCNQETAEKETRKACREAFVQQQLLSRVLVDTYTVLGMTPPKVKVLHTAEAQET